MKRRASADSGRGQGGGSSGGEGGSGGAPRQQPARAAVAKPAFNRGEKVIVVTKDGPDHTRSLRDAVIVQVDYHSVQRVRTTVYRIQYTGASKTLGTVVVPADQVLKPTPEVRKEQAALEKAASPKASSTSTSTAAGAADAGDQGGGPEGRAAGKHPPYTEMVKAAIQALKEVKGSSGPSIIKWLSASEWSKAFNMAKMRNQVAGAIKTLTAKGEIVEKSKGVYKLSPAEVKRMARERENKAKREKRASLAAAKANGEVADGEQPMFPCEDSLLPEIDAKKSSGGGGTPKKGAKGKGRAGARAGSGLPPRPELTNTLPLPAESIGDLLAVWDFTRAFGSVLGVQAVSLKDLQQAAVLAFSRAPSKSRRRSTSPTPSGGGTANVNANGNGRVTPAASPPPEQAEGDSDAADGGEAAADEQEHGDASDVNDSGDDHDSSGNEEDAGSGSGQGGSGSATESKPVLASRTLLSLLHLQLLRAALGRVPQTGEAADEEDALDTLEELREMLGDVLNAATWPEVLRCFLGALQRYHMALAAKFPPATSVETEGGDGNGPAHTPPTSDALQQAVAEMESGDYWLLGPQKGLRVLRALVDEAIDAPIVKDKVDDAVYLVENQIPAFTTSLKKAEGAERAAAAQKGALETSKRDLAVASEAVRKAKDALAKALKKGRVPRRVPLGMDRDRNRYWSFPSDPAHIHIECRPKPIKALADSGDESHDGGGGGQQQDGETAAVQPPPALEEEPAHWAQLTHQAELTELIESLDARGIRESALKKSLEGQLEKLMAGLGKPMNQDRAERKAAMAAAMAAAAEAGALDEPRRSSRIKVIQDTTTTAIATAGVAKVVANQRNSLGEASKSDKYRPLQPPWAQNALSSCDSKQILGHLKMELLGIEDQAVKLGAGVHGGDNDNRAGWRFNVKHAHHPQDLVQPLLALEEAMVNLQSLTTAGRADGILMTVDWDCMRATEDDQDVINYESPYEWGTPAAQDAAAAATAAATQGAGSHEQSDNENEQLMVDVTRMQGDDSHDSGRVGRGAAKSEAEPSAGAGIAMNGGGGSAAAAAVGAMGGAATVQEGSGAQNVSNGVKTEEAQPAGMDVDGTAGAAPKVQEQKSAVAAAHDTAAASSADNGKAHAASQGGGDEDGQDQTSDNDMADGEDEAGDDTAYAADGDDGGDDGGVDAQDTHALNFDWDQQRDSIALGSLKQDLQGALSAQQTERAAWVSMATKARTLSQVAFAIYCFSTRAERLLSQLQLQDQQGRSVESTGASNRKLNVRCTPTGEVVWSRLSGFPWWPALVVRAEDQAFAEALEQSGYLLLTFMGEYDQYRVNYRFSRPFIGGSKDPLVARASRFNRNLSQAVRMATKALIVAKQRYGDDDPNAPKNRPIRIEPVPATVTAGPTTRSSSQAVAEHVAAAVAVATGTLPAPDASQVYTRPPPRDRSMPPVAARASPTVVKSAAASAASEPSAAKKSKSASVPAAAAAVESKSDAAVPVSPKPKPAAKSKPLVKAHASPSAPKAPRPPKAVAVKPPPSAGHQVEPRQSGRKRKMSEAAKEAVESGYWQGLQLTDTDPSSAAAGDTAAPRKQVDADDQEDHSDSDAEQQHALEVHQHHDEQQMQPQPQRAEQQQADAQIQVQQQQQQQARAGPVSSPHGSPPARVVRDV